MFLRLTLLTLLIITTSLKVVARDNTQRHNGYSNSSMSSNFGFSMGFSGRGSGHNALGNHPVILHGVNFEFDSARLTPESSTVLNKVAENLRSAPGLAVEVGGHASAEGDDSYNLDLSQRRANAVREYLIEAGVNAESMQASGYGETRPIVSNANETGRSLNRRVELLRI